VLFALFAAVFRLGGFSVCLSRLFVMVVDRGHGRVPRALSGSRRPQFYKRLLHKNYSGLSNTKLIN